MSEVITTPEVPTDISDQLLNIEPPLQESKIRPTSRTRKLIGCLSVATVVAAPNLGEINRWSSLFAGGQMVPAVPGCPEYSPADDEPPPRPDSTETEVAGIRSAANKLEPGNISISTTLDQIRTFFDYPQTTFTSAHSGIIFNFYSDQEQPDWTINRQNFDDTFHAHLLTNLDYQNPGISLVMDCLKERIISNQEFAGNDYHIYIPSTPAACMGDWRVIYLENEPAAICKQSGFTPPRLQLSFAGAQASSFIMILTGGNLNHNAAGEEMSPLSTHLSRLIMHEAGHAFLSLTDTPVRLNPDERWAKYHDRRTLTEIGPLKETIAYTPVFD